MIYVSSACIRKTRIVEVIKYLAEHGIKNIELSGGTSYYSQIREDLELLKKIYSLNYVFHAYFPPPFNPFVLNLASCNDRIYYQSLNHYLQCVEMMKYLKCNILSIHAGFLIEININEIGNRLSRKIVYEENKAYERFCTAYEKISKICKKNNIELFLENNVLDSCNYEIFEKNNYLMMTDYQSIMKMKSYLNFNLLLDMGHLYVSSNTLNLEYGNECKKIKEFVRWIHLSENNGKKDEHMVLNKHSKITEEFYKILNPRINITLETVGNIEEIKKSIKIVEEGICNESRKTDM